MHNLKVDKASNNRKKIAKQVETLKTEYRIWKGHCEGEETKLAVKVP